MSKILFCEENKVYSTLIRIISECLGIQENNEAFNPNTSLFSLGINSIIFIKIIVSIETEFGIEFADDDLDYNRFPNFDSLISYVKNKIC